MLLPTLFAHAAWNKTSRLPTWINKGFCLSTSLLFPPVVVSAPGRPTDQKNTTVPADRFRLFVLTTSASASRRHPLSLLPSLPYLTSPHIRHDPRFDRLHVPFGYPVLGQAGISLGIFLDCKFACGAGCFALIFLSRMMRSRYLECCCRQRCKCCFSDLARPGQTHSLANRRYWSLLLGYQYCLGGGHDWKIERRKKGKNRKA